MSSQKASEEWISDYDNLHLLEAQAIPAWFGSSYDLEDLSLTISNILQSPDNTSLESLSESCSLLG